MRRLGTVACGLLLVCAALGLSAVSATAAPGWWACVKTVPKNSGHYSEKACTGSVPSGGKYELQPGIGKGKTFKGDTKLAGTRR